MSDDEKKPYKVLNPIAHGGRVERGETIYLTDEEAAAFSAEDIEALPVPADANNAGENVEGEAPTSEAAEHENTDSQESTDEHAHSQ